MLRAKFFGAFNYRVGGCSETLNESSIIGRSVVGAFREPGGNRNWRHNDRANIRPEPTRILHLLFLSHETSGNDLVRTAPGYGQSCVSLPQVWPAPGRHAMGRPLHPW